MLLVSGGVCGTPHTWQFRYFLAHEMSRLGSPGLDFLAVDVGHCKSVLPTDRGCLSVRGRIAHVDRGYSATAFESTHKGVQSRRPTRRGEQRGGLRPT